MCRRCRVCTGTEGRRSQSFWFSGIEEGMWMSAVFKERRLGRETESGERGERGGCRRSGRRRRTAEQAPGTEPRDKRRRGRVRNPDRGAGGAQQKLQPRFWRSVATPENADEEKRRRAENEEIEEKAEDAGDWAGDDGRQNRPPVQSLETKEGEDAPGTLTVAQEAHSKDSSHASGEEWQRQVRL
ncbi:hypothetical protein NDU88_005296 [Pleurodeles waltl]|uniref:Uncharacterized protein n=1 Tax=Pleurodeles waltl TaxID=8319 RepID=A0AAV7RJ86_PLEWA|nr:hypothetical protein NDU88_005296 [Pleurodeles waltl]